MAFESGPPRPANPSQLDILEFLIGGKERLMAPDIDLRRQLGLGEQDISRMLGLGQLELGRGQQGFQREQLRETGRQFDVTSALQRELQAEQLRRLRDDKIYGLIQNQGGQQTNFPRTTRTVFRGGIPTEEDFTPYLNYLMTRYGRVPTPKNPQ